MKHPVTAWLVLSALVACTAPQTGQNNGTGAPSAPSSAGNFSEQEKAIVARVGQGLENAAGAPADTLLARAGRVRAEQGPDAAGALIANGAASLISNSSAALIANGAASLISNSSAALVANSSAALIANGAASLIANGSAALKSVAPLTTRSPYRIGPRTAALRAPVFAIASSGGFSVEDTGPWPLVPAIGRVEGRRLIRDGRGVVVEESSYVQQVDGVLDRQLTNYNRTETVRASSLRPAGTYEISYGPQVSAAEQIQVLRQSVQVAGQALREATYRVRVAQVGSGTRTLLDGDGVNSRGLPFSRQATTSVVPGLAGSLDILHDERLAWSGGALRFQLGGAQASGSSLVSSGSIVVRLEATATEPVTGVVLYLDQRPDPATGKVELAYQGALLDAAGQAQGVIRSYRRNSDGLPVLGLEVSPGRIVAMPQGWLDLLREGSSGW